MKIEIIEGRLHVTLHFDGAGLSLNYMTRNRAILMISELRTGASKIESKLGELEHIPDIPVVQERIDAIAKEALFSK